MKKKVFFILVGFVMALSGSGQNRWNISLGGSISHLCEDISIYGKTYGWGGGAFVSGGYEMNFSPHWSLTPQLELAYNNNGASFSHPELSFSERHNNWRSFWSMNVPVIMSFRFNVSNGVGIRVGVGPYLQGALSGRRYGYNSDKTESMSGNFWVDRFNVGAMGELAVETGSHLSYMFRTQYPVLKEGWVRKTIVLSIGLRYSF